MEPENPAKKKVDRVELVPESVDRLNQWQKQIEESCPEVMISRKDLINWVILECKEFLTDSDFRKIREQYFDPVQYLKSLLRKAEAAKVEGKNLDVSDLLPTTPKPKRPKTIKTDSDENSNYSLLENNPENQKPRPAPTN